MLMLEYKEITWIWRIQKDGICALILYLHAHFLLRSSLMGLTSHDRLRIPQAGARTIKETNGSILLVRKNTVINDMDTGDDSFTESGLWWSILWKINYTRSITSYREISPVLIVYVTRQSHLILHFLIGTTLNYSARFYRTIASPFGQLYSFAQAIHSTTLILFTHFTGTIQ